MLIKEFLVFFGNVFDYFVFIIVFDLIILENVLLNKDCLFFLNKYINGKVNEVVKGFLVVNLEYVYIEVWKFLD